MQPPPNHPPPHGPPQHRPQYGPPPGPPHAPGPAAPHGVALSARARIDLAARMLLLLGAVVLAFVLGFATDLGETFNELQAGGPGGTYSTRLTFLALLCVSGFVMAALYVPVWLFLRVKYGPARPHDRP